MRRILLPAAALAACTTLLAGAQEGHAAGFQNMSQSATANGMGSVGTGNPDEPNANFYNPANMAFSEGFNLYVGNTNLLPTSSYTNANGETTSTERALFPPPNLHIAAPILDTGFAVGLGVTLPYGLGITWDDDWEGRGAVITQQLQTLNVNPNVAYRLPMLDLSFAIGVQIFASSVELKRKTILRDDTEVTAHLGGNGTGFGVTASAMYKASQALSIGLNFRSGSSINYTGRANFSGEEGTPFESTFVDQDISTTINIPHAVTLGIGYKISEQLFIGADVNFTTWSDYDKVELQFSRDCPAGAATCDSTRPGETNPPTTTIPADWNDAMAFRLGAQYDVNELLSVRLGLVYDMTPVPEQTLAPSLPDNNRIAIAGGLGFNLPFTLRADLGYQYVHALEREVTSNALPGTYNTSAHVLGLNVGYGF